MNWRIPIRPIFNVFIIPPWIIFRYNKYLWDPVLYAVKFRRHRHYCFIFDKVVQGYTGRGMVTLGCKSSDPKSTDLSQLLLTMYFLLSKHSLSIGKWNFAKECLRTVKTVISPLVRHCWLITALELWVLCVHIYPVIFLAFHD